MTHCTISQNHGLEEVLDNESYAALAAIHDRTPVRFPMEIENIDRAFGTMLSHEVSKANGENGLPDDTIHIDVIGSAGQSLAYGWHQELQSN